MWRKKNSSIIQNLLQSFQCYLVHIFSPCADRFAFSDKSLACILHSICMIWLNSWKKLPHNLSTKAGVSVAQSFFHLWGKIRFLSGIMVLRCCWTLLLTVLLSVITTWWVIMLRTQATQIMVYRKAFVSFQDVLTGISFTFWPWLGWFETSEVLPHCSSYPFPLILIKQSSLTLQKIFLCSSLTAYHLSTCLHLSWRKWMALNWVGA